MQPLGSDVQLDAAVAPRDGESGLRPQGGLVLHPELVFAIDQDVRLRHWIAMHHEHVFDDVPSAVELHGIGLKRSDGVGDRRQHLVADRDGARREPRFLSAVRGDDRNGLARVAYASCSQHGLVRLHQAKELARRKLVRRDHCADAAQPFRSRDVDADDACVRMRASKGRAEKHPFAVEIAAVKELALDLGHGIRPLDRLADAAADPRPYRRDAHRPYIPADARCTASRIFP